MEGKICFGCGVQKPLSAFHVARLGRLGRAAKCKSCLKNWHHDNHLRRVEKIEGYRETQNQKSKDRYANLSTESKHAHAKKLKDRRVSKPHVALSKNLMRALRRRPTDNPVTINELVEMWFDQGGLCALSRVKMTWGLGRYYPTSIDRIDSRLGYTKTNVRLICYAVNCFRGCWSDKEMLELARALVATADASSEKREAL